jgi:hypothetical protein
MTGGHRRCQCHMQCPDCCRLAALRSGQASKRLAVCSRQGSRPAQGRGRLAARLPLLRSKLVRVRSRRRDLQVCLVVSFTYPNVHVSC